MSGIVTDHTQENAGPSVPFACSATSASLTKVPVGAKVFQLNFQMHQESRDRVLERFRRDASVPKRSVILMQGGCSETRHETDHEKLFRQESRLQLFVPA